MNCIFTLVKTFKDLLDKKKSSNIQKLNCSLCETTGSSKPRLAVVINGSLLVPHALCSRAGQVFLPHPHLFHTERYSLRCHICVQQQQHSLERFESWLRDGPLRRYNTCFFPEPSVRSWTLDQTPFSCHLRASYIQSMNANYLSDCGNEEKVFRTHTI